MFHDLFVPAIELVDKIAEHKTEIKFVVNRGFKSILKTLHDEIQRILMAFDNLDRCIVAMRLRLFSIMLKLKLNRPMGLMVKTSRHPCLFNMDGRAADLFAVSHKMDGVLP